METMGIPGCINLSTAARQALTTEIAACRNGRSVESWLDLSGASVVKRDPVEVKGKGFMDMYLLCPKGVPPPLAKRLSMSANMATRRSSFGSGSGMGEFEQMSKRASQRSRGSHKPLMSSEIEEETSVVAELEALKKEHERLQISERSALAEVESLQLSLAEANSKLMAGNSGKKDSQTSSLTSPPAIAPPQDGNGSSIRETEELRLQLLVTTKSLMRARQALLDKEAEIDLMELEMQRLRAKAHMRSSAGDIARMADAMSVHTKRSSFLARTQNLLDVQSPSATTTATSSDPPIRHIRKFVGGSTGNLSSIAYDQFGNLDELSEEEEELRG